jgi:hypothetical protein
MKHKTDAKLQANQIIDKHKINCLSYEHAINCAITTVELIIENIKYGTDNHSLFKRTLNYLNSIQSKTDDVLVDDVNQDISVVKLNNEAIEWLNKRIELTEKEMDNIVLIKDHTNFYNIDINKKIGKGGKLCAYKECLNYIKTR